MRDFASCYNEHADLVSDSSCSGTENATSARDPSVQRSVTYFYRTKLSTRGEFLVRVTWSNSLVGQGFFLGVEEDLRSHPQHVPHKLVHDGGATTSLQIIKKKGSRSYVSGDSVVEVYWDISSTRYDAGLEPVGGF
ncbi:hypothetical protein Taro_049811 [Colocasia esculenta]|uniref:Uncharacterized protein n=1 Tax=Colocasia esculenta TaxID=4460 RepID=A0A843XC87_COLES|nr:hypothetical protein [Colocasia esculenta]